MAASNSAFAQVRYAALLGSDSLALNCTAKVYEWVENTQGQPELVINFSNCIHCKTCDIKPYKVTKLAIAATMR